VKRRRRPLRALAAFGALLVVALAAPNAVLAAPAGFFGVGGWSYPTSTQAASLSAAGLGLVRGAIAWGDIQTSADPASRNWSYPDQLADEAAEDNFNVVFDLNGCAVWACGTVDAPPTGAELTAYEDFVSAAVARYAPTSSFWDGQPAVPTITWQVWNEVNAGVSWPDPTPAAYATFLSAIYQTIKAADPSATVIMSGLDPLPALASGMTLTSFLQGLYAQPGFTASTDAIAINAYAPDAASSVNALDQARDVALENNDAAMPTWVTEMGWATAGPPSAFTITPDQQSTDLEQAWSSMLDCAPRWNLQHVLWFALQDVSASTMGAPDYWGFNDGLLNADGTPKPAYATFLQFLGSSPADAPGPCTLPGGFSLDYTDPHTTILAAPSDTNNTASQIVKFTATENGQQVPGMTYQCSLDSSPWTPCSSPFNAANHRAGDHTLIVRGIDPEGNIDPSPASVTWVLDLTRPETVITWHSRRASRRGRIGLRFKGIDPGGMGSFQCRVDHGRWRPCGSPYTTPALHRGHHTVFVRAIDRAGNVQRYPAYLRFAVRA
jgi:hypothetical protein